MKIEIHVKYRNEAYSYTFMHENRAYSVASKKFIRESEIENFARETTDGWLDDIKFIYHYKKPNLKAVK